MNNLSLIIPIRNREKKLSHLIERLQNVKPPRALNIREIIFVDNGSVDNTFAVFTDLAPISTLPISIVTYKRRLTDKIAAREGISNSKSKLNLVVRPDLSDLAGKLNRLERKITREKLGAIPALSVIMPVYNSEKYLAQSIKSVIKQKFRNFELIIIDDASSDKSRKIIQKFQSRFPFKIRTVRNERRIGKARTLNQAIDLARAEFIVRCDSHDISHPKRLQKQIKYLQENPKIVAVGCQSIMINKEGKIIGERTFPQNFDEVYRSALKLDSAHPATLMFSKKRLPRDYKFYDVSRNSSENLDFIFKLLKYGRIENLSEHLIFIRDLNDSKGSGLLRKSHIAGFASRLKGVVYQGYVPNFEAGLSALASLFKAVVLKGPKRGRIQRKNYRKFVEMLRIL